MSDEYELMPAEELEKLRKEVDLLKANPLGTSGEGKTLLQGVEQLNASINRLIKLFSDVDQDMANEYAKVKGVDEQLSDLKDQNQKIASGILAIAKLVEEQHEQTQQHAQDLHQENQDQQFSTPSFSQQSPSPSGTPVQQQVQSGSAQSVPGGSSQQGYQQEVPTPTSSVNQQQPPHDPFATIPREHPVDPWQPQQVQSGSAQSVPGGSSQQGYQQEVPTPTSSVNQQQPPQQPVPQPSVQEPSSMTAPPTPPENKKGLFGGLFKK